ncbi:MAG: tetratricopeptide repeat protein [Nitrospira sp. CR1.1]|nr:tetratricopeptide repeat protein [Nitrospira sp. CR1.1]
MWFKLRSVHASAIATVLVGSAAFSIYPAWGAAHGSPVSNSPPAEAESLARADELNRQALTLHHSGRFADALPLAKEALTLREAALVPKDLLIAESLNTLGIVLQESDYKAARPLLDRALKIRQEAFPSDPLAIAESLTNLSRTLYAAGQFAQARPMLDQAVHIRETSLGPTAPQVAVSLVHLSIVVSQHGDLQHSRSLMERALSILNPLEHDHSLELAMGLNYYGNILRRQGEFAEARVPLERSLSIRERILGPSHPHVARTLSRMGQLEAVTGNYQAALPLFQRALRINEESLGATHAEIAGDLNEIGSVHRALGNFAEAKRSFERALRIQKATVGPQHPFVAVTLNALGQLAAQVNKPDEAKSLFQEALAIQDHALGHGHIFSTETLTALGYLDVQRGALKEATDYFERASRIRESLLGSTHPDVAASLFDLARGLHAQGKLKAAREHYERARRSTLMHISANQNLEEASQTRVWAQQLKGLYDYELLLATVANKPSLDTTPPTAMADSFLVAEQARGWMIQSAIARAMARQSLEGDTHQLVLKLDNLRRQRQAVWGKLTELYSQSVEQRNETDLANVQRELETVQATILSDEKDLEHESPRYAEFALPKPATISGTQSLLTPNEALISWLTLSDRICIWLVRSGQPPLYRENFIPRSKLADLVNQVRTSLTPAFTSSPDVAGLPPFAIDASRELYRLLIEPVSSQLDKIEHLVLIPDSVLMPLPLAALLHDQTNRWPNGLADFARTGGIVPVKDLVRYKDLPWLGSAYTLTVIPSASALKLLRESTSLKNGRREQFIGFGDPVLQGTGISRGGALPKHRGARVLRSELELLNRLPGTREELLAVAAAMNVPPEGHVFLSEQATETQVTQLNRSGRLGSANVLSFATHGLLSGELLGLKQPALVLTPPPFPTDEDDGLLSLDDILHLNLARTNWVILSACNTAGGDGSGDNLTGLARAFFFAGAKALLVSQWSVDDRATQFLMTETFKYYGGNTSHTPAQALRRGMLAVMAEANSNPKHVYFAHPFAWAAFFLVGEGHL